MKRRNIFAVCAAFVLLSFLPARVLGEQDTLSAGEPESIQAENPENGSGDAQTGDSGNGSGDAQTGDSENGSGDAQTGDSENGSGDAQTGDSENESGDAQAESQGEESQDVQSEDSDSGSGQEASEEIELDRGSSSNSIQANGKILDNIYLESVNLSQMSVEEALQAAEKRMQEIIGYQIILHMDDLSVSVSAEELGVSGDNLATVAYAAGIGQSGNVIKRYKVKKDLEKEPLQLQLQYQVDTDTLRAALEQYCVPLNREVSNYGLAHDGGEFHVVNGKRGVTLKEEESLQKAEQYLTQIWRDGIGDLELEVDIIEPQGSEEELARVKDVLGQGSTDYSASNAARATNVRNGTQKLNGKVLYPGESFSVLNAMLPFNEENGYEMAASYLNGTVVDSFGGGICQVSTTLYLAVLRSELEVTERHNHSMIVKYVKPSMDAAIAEGAKDFQFVNNLDAPIYIEGYAASGTVSFVIYGEEYRPEDRTVTFESETLETIEPTTELTADTEMAFGSIEQTQSSHTGYSAKLWKIVTENGEETKEEVNSSYYQMGPNKYKVGVKTANAEAQSAMYSAIAANDLNQVYKVWSQY